MPVPRDTLKKLIDTTGFTEVLEQCKQVASRIGRIPNKTMYVDVATALDGIIPELSKAEKGILGQHTSTDKRVIYYEIFDLIDGSEILYVLKTYQELMSMKAKEVLPRISEVEERKVWERWVDVMHSLERAIKKVERKHKPISPSGR